MVEEGHVCKLNSRERIESSSQSTETILQVSSSKHQVNIRIEKWLV